MGVLDYLFADKPIAKWVNHRNLYLLGLITIANSLAWSNALMSVGLGILIGNWILELNFKAKSQLLSQNKLALVLLSFFILHLVGLFWTSDLAFAAKDIRIKLPLLAFPLVIGSTSRLNQKEWKIILVVYLSSLLVLTLVSLSKYLGWFGRVIIDKRELSNYISHIRYGLNICFAIFLLWKFPTNSQQKGLAIRLFLTAWFTVCLLLFELYTGLVILLLLAGIILLNFLFFRNRKSILKEAGVISILICLVAAFFFINDVRNDFLQKVELDYNQEPDGVSYTQGGEEYWSDIHDERIENGVYVRRFIAWKEIEREWNKRSEIDFMHADLKKQTLDQTLNRFLSSKGLKKDSVGISKLSDLEIKAIEKGIANVYYLHHNALQNRIHKTFFELAEYERTGNANGFSLAMRLEFWKTVKRIIVKNFWIGVGTGDIKNAFKAQYEKDQSKLEEKYRRRAHNQYLSVFATFGIIGLLVFLIHLFFPLFLALPDKKTYLLFIGILCLSFLTEDTLETQAGVTLFAFFNALLLLGIMSFNSKEIDKP